ncbi:hypothetical protein Hamer_G012528 [Homarus americanus]|uniref:Uncharacterized protein n=1 Tax=Homarus americanus TaxID=6706 RepID=A0A8J5K6L8_HOMAM|nr:hypothetical protein Hamer_G012528 [Homarus americanus]
MRGLLPYPSPGTSSTPSISPTSTTAWLHLPNASRKKRMRSLVSSSGSTSPHEDNPDSRPHLTYDISTTNQPTCGRQHICNSRPSLPTRRRAPTCRCGQGRTPARVSPADWWAWIDGADFVTKRFWL